MVTIISLAFKSGVLNSFKSEEVFSVTRACYN